MKNTIHPLLTPEHYLISPYTNTSIVKSLYVSQSLQISPQIITDTLDNVLSSFYVDYTPFLYRLGLHIHFYCDPILQYSSQQENVVATQYYRNFLLRNHGVHSKDVLRGPVIFFGSSDLKNNTLDFSTHSVPYHLVEEILNIYDIQLL